MRIHRAHEAVPLLRGGRLPTGVTVAVAPAPPVVVLAFAVRQEINPIITADTAAIRASMRFRRTPALTPWLEFTGRRVASSSPA